MAMGLPWVRGMVQSIAPDVASSPYTPWAPTVTTSPPAITAPDRPAVPFGSWNDHRGRRGGASWLDTGAPGWAEDPWNCVQSDVASAGADRPFPAAGGPHGAASAETSRPNRS